MSPIGLAEIKFLGSNRAVAATMILSVPMQSTYYSERLQAYSIRPALGASFYSRFEISQHGSLSVLWDALPGRTSAGFVKAQRGRKQ